MGVRGRVITEVTDLLSAINDPAFEKDIYWAEDGLSGEIPDRRKVG